MDIKAGKYLDLLVKFLPEHQTSFFNNKHQHVLKNYRTYVYEVEKLKSFTFDSPQFITI